MSKITYLITGMTKEEIRDYDFPRIESKNDVFYPTKGYVSGHDSVRINLGLMVGSKDLDSERKRLLNSTPKSLKLTLVERIKSLF